MIHVPEPEQEYDEDEEYYGNEILSEDAWQDSVAYQKIKGELPASWHVVKVVDFDGETLRTLDAWLKLNCKKSYKRIGFRSGCSYTVGVAFASAMEATIFKLRWG